MAQYDDLDVKKIAIIGIISIVATAVSALAVQVIFYAMANWVDDAKQASSDYRRQNNFIREQTEQISSYGVDPVNGNVTIPIQDAIKLAVSEADSGEAPAVSTDDI